MEKLTAALTEGMIATQLTNSDQWSCSERSPGHLAT